MVGGARAGYCAAPRVRARPEESRRDQHIFEFHLVTSWVLGHLGAGAVVCADDRLDLPIVGKRENSVLPRIGQPWAVRL